MTKWAPGKIYVDKDSDPTIEDFVYLHKDIPMRVMQVVEHIDFLLDTTADAFDAATKTGVLVKKEG